MIYEDIIERNHLGLFPQSGSVAQMELHKNDAAPQHCQQIYTVLCILMIA
jgi:hypothetical protein